MSSLRKTFGEYLFVALTLLIGLTASTWLAVAEHKASGMRVQEQFRIAARDRINVLTRALQNNMAAGHSVASFFLSSSDVDHGEFSIFASQVLKDYPYIEAIAWTPHVSREKRAEYERAARRFVPDYVFRDIEGTELVPAASRPGYYPVFYLEPENETTSRMFGVDFMTSPVRREAMERAMQTGQTSVTAKVTLLSSRRPGVLFFAPVTKRGGLEGFVTSIIPLNKIVAKAVEPLNKEGVNIIAHDISEPVGDKEPLFIYSSRLKPTSDAEVMSIYRSNVMRQQANIDVAGRTWRITVVPSEGYFRHGDRGTTMLIFFTGCIFTLLLALYMISRLRENLRISHEIELRTKEVELILHSTSEGILRLDAYGNIEFANEMACELLGYSLIELQGKDYHLLIQHSGQGGQPLGIADATVSKVLQTGIGAHNVNDQVFWRSNFMPMQVEYTASPMKDGNVVIGAVVIFRDITERKITEQNLERMALYDPLTNLANRRLFLELLDKAISGAGRRRGKIGLMYLDLNNFKPVNDTMGHMAGDMLLEAFAARISGLLRRHDSMARLGGDEFAVIMEQLHSTKECETLIERILEALREPFMIMDHPVHIGSSIGVAFYPDHAATLDELINAADNAMYEAKRDKSRQFVFAARR